MRFLQLYSFYWQGLRGDVNEDKKKKKTYIIGDGCEREQTIWLKKKKKDGKKIAKKMVTFNTHGIFCYFKDSNK